nr:TonB-dependent receptor [Psychrobacter sp. PraFG1]UNK05349.1 TonB-dependent receptor [Psychrobacter sp. PraFG1]
MDNNISKSDNAHSLSLEAGRYLTPTTQVSARVSHSERLPASQELYANGAHLATNTWERGNLQLDKESTDGIELSLRYDNNKNFDLSTSVFYNDTDDYIYAKTQDLVTDGESKGFRLVDYHQSDAKHYGGEIKARYYLNDYISIGGFSDIAIIELKDKQLGSKYAPDWLRLESAATLLRSSINLMWCCQAITVMSKIRWQSLSTLRPAIIW